MFIMFGLKLFFPWFFAGVLIFKVFSVSLLAEWLLTMAFKPLHLS